MQAFSSFVEFVIGLVTFPEPPDFLDGLGSNISLIGSYVADTGVWIPWSLLVAIVGFWAVVLVVAYGVKAVRILASFATFGGGSAA